jgi:hypothetical protein
MKAEASKLKSQPHVFQSSRCAASGQALELPVVHFMCGHSFNLRSLGESDRCATRGGWGATGAAQLPVPPAVYAGSLQPVIIPRNHNNINVPRHPPRTCICALSVRSTESIAP